MTEEQVREIRVLYRAGNTTQRALAAEYGISQVIVWEVIHRHYWKHVD